MAYQYVMCNCLKDLHEIPFFPNNTGMSQTSYFCIFLSLLFLCVQLPELPLSSYYVPQS